jgi:hypothetical protein
MKKLALMILVACGSPKHVDDTHPPPAHAPDAAPAASKAAATSAPASSAPVASAPATSAAAVANPKDPCDPSALGLKNVKRADFWKPPEGCQDTGIGAPVIHSDADFHARFGCPKMAAGVDFTKSELHEESRGLPPAGAGWDTYYDDKTLYVVSRQRSPCPNDPRPMPMNVTVYYLLPAGSPDRDHKMMACTLPASCK